MIQRQQTLWLLLAAAAAVFSFMFPFVTGQEIVKNVLTARSVNAANNFIILVLTGGSIVLSVAIIFLYKNRKQQMQFCWLGLLLTALIILLYILQMRRLIKPVLSLSCIFPFLMLAGYFMAFRCIRRDEKLVKSLDKLR